MHIITSDAAPAAIGPYSQALRSEGLLYCSGQIALKPGASELTPGGVGAETRQALLNLAQVLKAGGSSLEGVLKTTVYLLSMEDFQAMNEVYAEFFPEHKPARATVAVAALPKGARVEVDAIARVAPKH